MEKMFGFTEKEQLLQEREQLALSPDPKEQSHILLRGKEAKQVFVPVRMVQAEKCQESLQEKI